MDYSNIHKKNILSESISSLPKLLPGMIVRFNYKGVDAHEPRPMVLVLNPSWKKKLHGLALRVLKENELVKLSRMTKFKRKATTMKTYRTRNLGKTATINEPEVFYKNKLKKFIKNVEDNPYRTYLRKGISSVRIIDYKFKDMDVRVSKEL